MSNDTSWRYQPEFDTDTNLWSVVEEFPGIGRTNAIAPQGDTLEDLLATLHLMAADVEEFEEELDDAECADVCLACVQEESYESGYLDGKVSGYNAGFAAALEQGAALERLR